MKNEQQIRFLILMEGRSGSTLLNTLLRCHPDVRIDGEILTDEKVHLWLLDSRSNELATQKAYGFKCRLQYLHRIPNPNAVFNSFVDANWRIIDLRRYNLLRQTLSAQIGKRLNELTGSWFVRQGEVNGPARELRVNIDCEWLVKRAAWLRDQESWRDELLNGVPHLSLVYERDLLQSERHQTTANKVFSFIGLEPVDVGSDLVRITGDDLTERVANMDQVLAAIRGTWLEEYFDAQFK